MLDTHFKAKPRPAVPDHARVACVLVARPRMLRCRMLDGED